MKYLKLIHRNILSKYPLNQIKFYSSNGNIEWHQPQGDDTGIVIYNSIAKKKVPLVLKNKYATWYSCGPTVYDSAHIGHASCYVKLDIIQRILVDYFHIKLITSMGVTDIDDKIIKRSQDSKTTPEAIAKEYELEFWKNMGDLGVNMPNIITRVTDHIPTIKNFIADLIEKNLGYVAPDKSVYFDTLRYGQYGKLQGSQHIEEELDSFYKKSKADFALWKTHKPGEPYWETEWGNGRPGWHIECSAMASRLFGQTLDFHAGGIDLQFPHHENEEAQSCAFHGNQQWVNYWLHAGHLNIKGDVKMSKSLKNTISIDDLLTAHDAATFRMACLLSHFSHPMEYCEDMMKNAKAMVSKLKYFAEACTKYLNDNNSRVKIDENTLLQKLDQTKASVDKFLRNNFDTANSIMHLVTLATFTSKMLKDESDSPTAKDFNPISISLVLNYVEDTMNCFGVVLDKNKVENNRALPDVIDTLVKFRHSVRVHALENKQTVLLSECDVVRNALRNYNVKINDQPGVQTSSWIYSE